MEVATEAVVDTLVVVVVAPGQAEAEAAARTSAVAARIVND